MDGLTPVSDRNWRRSYQSVVENGCTEMEGKKIKAFYLKLLYNIRFILSDIKKFRGCWYLVLVGRFVTSLRSELETLLPKCCREWLHRDGG